MQKLLLILGLTVATLTTKAQDYSQGKVTYKEVMQLKFDFSDNPQMESMKAMIPSSRSYNKELMIKDGKTIYRNGKNDDEESGDINVGGQSESGGIELNIQISQPDNIVYQEPGKDVVVQKRDFMGRTFLIDGTTDKSWKITNEEKEIAGYTCQKAVLDDTINVEAWFAKDIPVFSGPESFGKLPGLILEVTMENPDRTITATDVAFEEINEELLPPSKGKKVTAAKFREIADAKLKEMQAEYGGKGNVIMITEDQ
ncbi:MAG: GLPGLI family protein [bacterium]|nr:GLPGLI family protein [bacterium]